MDVGSTNVITHISQVSLSKEVSKSNFRQYAEMEKQRWEESERRSQEDSRSDKIRDGESQKKEDAGARKGRKVAIHNVFPMICGSGGSRSNVLKRRVRSQLAR